MASLQIVCSRQGQSNCSRHFRVRELRDVWERERDSERARESARDRQRERREKRREEGPPSSPLCLPMLRLWQNKKVNSRGTKTVKTESNDDDLGGEQQTTDGQCLLDFCGCPFFPSVGPTAHTTLHCRHCTHRLRTDTQTFLSLFSLPFSLSLSLALFSYHPTPLFLP